MDEREEIRERLDVAEVISGYIPIKPAGRSFKAVCPFHSEKTPSLMITPDKGIWHCFGCHRGGDIFSFVMEIEGLSFPEALKMLAERSGVNLPERSNTKNVQKKQDRSLEALSLATRYFEKALSSKAGLAAKSYLSERGITDVTCKEFRIGFSPDTWDALTTFMLGKGFSEAELTTAGLTSKGKKGPIDRFRGRLMFPIMNPTGKVVGFGARVMPGSDGAKYLNSSESAHYHKSEVIYGFPQARDAIREADRAVIVEGYFDVILSWQSGVKYIVASSGTALTSQQLRRLSRLTKTIVLAFDPDSAGEQATKRAIELAVDFDISLYVIALPGGADPADMALEQPEEWKRLTQKGVYVMDYLIETALSGENLSSGIGKKRAAAKLTPYIGLLPDPIEQAHYVRLLSGRLGVPEVDVRRAVSKVTGTPSESEDDSVAETLEDPTGPVTEARLLSLMLTHLMPLAPIFALLDPEAFTDQRYRTLYTELKDRYNEDSQGAVPDIGQFSIDSRDTAHFLTLSADYVAEHTTARAEDEVLFCVNRLRQEYLHRLQERLERALRQAESRSDKVRQEEILQKLQRVLTEGRRRIEIDFSLHQ